MSEIAGQMDMFGNVSDGEEAYREFEDKFKPKKTTDDYYTPPNIFEAVTQWVMKEYGIKPKEIIRPFWPGGDYAREYYPPGCCVIDNPPFSIITQIQRFYNARGIRFFLFAPTLTLFSGRDTDSTYIPCGVQITYANGAEVNTSFATNLDTCRVRSAPDLYKAVRVANDANVKAVTKQLPKYSYPPHVLTAAAAYQYSRLGIDYRLEKSDCVRISALDAQKSVGKTIFGCGYLLSETAARENERCRRAAAERAATTVWQLSHREWEIVKELERKRRDTAHA